MQVLIIDDDRDSSAKLERCLTAEGFFPSIVTTAEEGIAFCKTTPFECVLLGTKLLDLSGSTVLRLLRRAKIKTPVIALSSKPTNQELITLLGEGADDYVAKPFDCDVLVARMRAVIRRTKGHADATVMCGELEYNLDQKVLKVDGQPVNLGPAESKVIQVLFSRPGQAFDREMFLNQLYSLQSDAPEDRVVDVHIGRARRKIKAFTEGRDYVETVRGRGYRLRDPRV